MTKQKTLLVLILFLLSGCYILHKNYNPNKRTEFYRSSNSKSDYLSIYKINYTHCGCANIHVEKLEKEQLVYSFSYACPTGLLPYKQLKQYDINNKLIATVCFRATDKAVYDIPLDDQDRNVIRLLDSLSKTNSEVNSNYKFCKVTITGFNRVDCTY